MSYLNNFNHQIFGKKGEKKLVFLHGLMGSLANWRKITSKFADDYEIFIYDQRGHGKSFQPPAGYSPEDYATDLKLLLDELAWSSIQLIGHSMGGRNALSFATQWPEYLEHLVIEDISPALGKSNEKHTLSWVEKVPTPFNSREEARDFFANTYPGLISDHPQPLVLSQYFYSNITEDKATGKADWRFYKPGIVASLQAGHQKDRWQEWEALQVETLVIRGELSQELSAQDYVKMLKSNEKAKGIEIAGAGHWVHSDKPDEFVSALKNFLL